MITATTDDPELDAVEKGIIVSIAVLAVDFTTGILLALAGHEWAMERALEFAGIYTVAAAALWVGYILYNLIRTLTGPHHTQTTLSDWEESGEKR